MTSTAMHTRPHADLTPQLCTSCNRDKPRCAFFTAQDSRCITCTAVNARHIPKGPGLTARYETTSGDASYAAKPREPRKNHR